MLFSICMCTYKREHLRNTLESIANLVLPKNSTVEVLVVDNDEAKSAMKIVESLKNTYPFALRYFSEPRKNISIARNKYLQEAKGEWIASLDDDEVADKNWLLELYNSATKFQAHIVFGNVKPIYPEFTPEWIEKGDFFARKRRKTGSSVSSGAANCTLIKKSIIDETGYKFDLRYGLTGGEDSEFHHRLFRRGYKLIHCDEAWVSEEVEKKRLTLNYLKTRNLRIGYSFSEYRLSNKDFIFKVSYFLKTFLLLNLRIIFLLPLLFSGRVLFNKKLLKVYNDLGKLKFFLFKKNVEMYK